MQKKRSISQNKNNRKKTLPKKKTCSMCQTMPVFTTVMQNALYRKYSAKHFSEPEIINKYIKTWKQKQNQIDQQYLQKYYKSVHRKHEFKKIKQIYKMHHQYPRLFMPEIRNIINKCHHRKRLLQYFKIAKILGIRVQTVKFSTFLLSVSKSHFPFAQKKKSYDRLIGHISGYQFSEEVEKQLIETLNGKQNKMNISNYALQYPFADKGEHNKQHETATSLHARFRIE